MNNLSLNIFKKFAEDYALLESRVVDIGSFDVNGTYRPIFTEGKYIGADIREGPNVDVIVGSKEWDALKDVDAVISGNTFEHVEDDAGLLKQVYVILKPGGMLCVSAPSVGPVHDCPRWYRYYSTDSLSSIIRGAGFEVLSCDIDPHPEFEFVTCIARKNPRKVVK